MRGITITDPAKGPASSSATENSCLEATPDGSFHLRVLIPTSPEQLDTPTDLSTISQVGLALDGVTIFGDAPSVADRGGLPALDACGGHIDPSGYYHWHFGAESIQTNLDEAGADVTCSVDQDPEALIGFAYDGYAIYGPQEDRAIPTDLDACSGHTSETADLGTGYHYHLSYDSPNLPTCRVGATATAKLTSPDNSEAALPMAAAPMVGPAEAAHRPTAPRPAADRCLGTARWLSAVPVGLGVAALVLIGAGPASAHDDTGGAIALTVNDRRVLGTAPVPFTELGLRDTSGDGVIDADELRAQQPTIAAGLVETIRGHVRLDVDGGTSEIIGAGLAPVESGRAPTSTNVTIMFAEVAPDVVEVEVAVPRLRPAGW